MIQRTEDVRGGEREEAGKCQRRGEEDFLLPLLMHKHEGTMGGIRGQGDHVHRAAQTPTSLGLRSDCRRIGFKSKSFRNR